MSAILDRVNPAPVAKGTFHSQQTNCFSVRMRQAADADATHVPHCNFAIREGQSGGSERTIKQHPFVLWSAQQVGYTNVCQYLRFSHYPAFHELIAITIPLQCDDKMPETHSIPGVNLLPYHSHGRTLLFRRSSRLLILSQILIMTIERPTHASPEAPSLFSLVCRIAAYPPHQLPRPNPQPKRSRAPWQRHVRTAPHGALRRSRMA
jgi:hypothetical protein